MESQKLSVSDPVSIYALTAKKYETKSGAIAGIYLEIVILLLRKRSKWSLVDLSLWSAQRMEMNPYALLILVN